MTLHIQHPQIVKPYYKWVDLSIFGLCVVAFLGMVMRSKMVFALPFINYNNLLEAHSHFSFGGWVTLILMTLFVYELLPVAFNKKPVYQWLLGSIAFCSWGMLISFIISGYNTISTIISLVFVLTTYFFGLILILDLLKSKLESSVILLATSSIICLIISSCGPWIISYSMYSKSFDVFLYRNSLFTYLHFQYNGFFTMAVFALLFNLVLPQINPGGRKKIYRFSFLLCASVIPTLFLSYLWQDPNTWYWVIAVIGSLLLIFCLYFFILSASSLQTVYRNQNPVIRFLVFLSAGSFMLKIFLQCFMIFPRIGNFIFGDRPAIMGFLHLVFLGFVTLFIISYLTKQGLLNSKIKMTKFALVYFAIAVILNEVFLITQGMATLVIAGSILFPWLLWGAGILLFTGTILIAFARIQSGNSPE